MADKSGLAGGLKSAEGDTKTAAARIQATLNDLGKRLSVSITAPLVAMGTIAAASFEGINKSFITLRTQTGLTGNALADMRKTFLDVLSRSADGAQETAGRMALLQQTNGSNVEVLGELTEAFEQLNRFTGESPIREVTDLFEQWNITGRAQIDVLDMLFRAYQQTGAPVQSLAASILEFGPILRGYNFSLEQSIAMLANWDAAGVDAGKMMRSLSFGITNMLEKGIKNIPGALAAAIEAIKAARTETDSYGIAIGIFGRRTGVQLADAIRTGRMEFQELQKALANGDSLKKASEDTDTLGRVMLRFKNSVMVAFAPLEGQYQSALKGFGAVLSDVAKAVQSVIAAFSRLDGGAQVAILAIAGIAAAAGPLMLGLSGLMAAWGLVGASMTAVAGPAAVVVAALAAVVSAVAGLRGVWQLFYPEIASAWKALTDYIAEGANNDAKSLGMIGDAVDGLGIEWVDRLNAMGGAFFDFTRQIISGSNSVNEAVKRMGGAEGFMTQGAGSSWWNGMFLNNLAPEFMKNWKRQIGQGADTLMDLMRGKGFTGEDLNKIYDAGEAWKNVGTAVKKTGEDSRAGAIGIDELTAAMGNAKKAALTLEDALAMRQGARPLEAMTAELKKVMEMAARFPSVIDPDTIALLTGQAFEGGGGKIPFAGAYDALLQLNPVMAETVMLYKNMEEAQKQFQQGMDLVAETAKLEAEAMRDVFRGAEVDNSVKERRDKEKRAWDDAGQMFSKIGESLSQIGDAMGSKLLSGIGAVITAIMSVVMAYIAMSVAAAAASATAAAAWIAILGPIYLVMAAVMAVISLFGIFGGSAAEKVKTGWTRAMDEIEKKWNDWADRMTDALVEFVETGKFAFEDLVKSIGEDLLKIGLKWAVIVPVLNFMGVPSSAFAAKGLVNDGGSVSKFAQGGGVVTRPMRFSMGMGLIGEGAKPAEAYVPLTRTRSGDLGVSVEGMATGAKVNVTVNNFGPTPVTKTETVDADGTRNIRLTIEGIVKSGMARGAFDGVAGSVWGLRRRGAAYG